MNPGLEKYLKERFELRPEDHALVDSLFVPRKTKRNETLVRKGTVAKHVFFVVKGCLRVFLTDDDDRESTRFLIFEGSFGTAFPSFRLKAPLVATVQSLEPSEILQLSFEDQELLFRQVPGWETMVRKDIELAYVASIERIESLITMNASDRYQLLLKRNPEIVLRLPSRIVADYLGLSQETLSRLKSKR